MSRKSCRRGAGNGVKKRCVPYFLRKPICWAVWIHNGELLPQRWFLRGRLLLIRLLLLMHCVVVWNARAGSYSKAAAREKLLLQGEILPRYISMSYINELLLYHFQFQWGAAAMLVCLQNGYSLSCWCIGANQKRPSVCLHKNLTRNLIG